jgi:YHYH protein
MPVMERPADQPPAPPPPSSSAYSDLDDEHDTFVAKTIFVFVAVFFVLFVAGLVFWLYTNKNNARGTSLHSSETSQAEGTETAEGLALDPNKNYGDTYADGVLPAGDKKYVTNGAKKGYIYLCRASFVPAHKAGATTRGPWFVGTTKWNANKKPTVQGNASWPSRLTDKTADGVRIIGTNGLPAHPTGNFPVTLLDPVYNFDRNPNNIKAQELTYSLPAEPKYSGTPSCMGGDAGVILTGVPLLNGFDAAGRDAGAWEVQDACDGHPQGAGVYHYHTLSRCIRDIGVSTVIGFALDGFPITGPKVGDKNYLTTNDLDECHGIVSDINLDGKKIRMYHYVMTQDFPYSVSCFRGTTTPSNGDLQNSQNSGGGSSQNLQVQGNQQQPLHQ